MNWKKYVPCVEIVLTLLFFYEGEILKVARAQSSDLRVVVGSGDLAPTGDVFFDFPNVAIADNGTVSFWGIASSTTGGSNRIGIWQAAQDEPIVPIAINGDQTSHPTCTPLQGAGIQLHANGVGESAFFVYCPSGLGIASHRDSLSVLAAAGDAVPVIPGAQFVDGLFRGPNDSYTDFSLSETGRLAFTAMFEGPEIDYLNNAGLFAGTDQLTLIAREGDLAPLPSGNAIFRNIGSLPGFSGEYPTLRAPSQNSDGVITFWAGLGFGENQDPVGSLWKSHTDQLSPIVVSGRQFDPMNPSWRVFIDGFFQKRTTVNDLGDVLFGAEIYIDGEAPNYDSKALIVERGGTLEIIAAEGFDIGQPNRVFSSIASDGVLNNSGQIAFAARTADDTPTILLDDGGELIEVVRAGDPSPGRPGEQFSNLGPAALTDSGMVLFQATTEDAGGNPATSGFWLVEANQDPQPLVAIGDEIEWPIGEISGLTGIDQYAYNDRGELVFRAQLSGGRQAVVVARPLPVPEPTGFVVVFCASFVFVWTQRNERFRIR